MSHKPYIVCLTGGIGSGKSIVAQVCRLSNYDIYVYDCDSEAKHLMNKDTHLQSELVSHFGNQVMLSSGDINRQYLASIIFNSDEKRKWVNDLVHTLVRKDIEHNIANSPLTIFMIETAIPSTSLIDSICDEIWLVEAPEQTRINRAVNRDNSNEEKIVSRIEAQKHEFCNLKCKKVRKISNSDNDELIPHLLHLIENINKEISFTQK